jgi:hypothetical protein
MRRWNRHHLSKGQLRRRQGTVDTIHWPVLDGQKLPMANRSYNPSLISAIRPVVDLHLVGHIPAERSCQNLGRRSFTVASLVVSHATL